MFADKLFVTFNIYTDFFSRFPIETSFESLLWYLPIMGDREQILNLLPNNGFPCKQPTVYSQGYK